MQTNKTNLILIISLFFFPFPAVQEYIQDKLRESNKASKRIVLNCRQRKKKQTCYFKIHFRISGEKKRPPNTHSLPQLASPPPYRITTKNERRPWWWWWRSYDTYKHLRLRTKLANVVTWCVYRSVIFSCIFNLHMAREDKPRLLAKKERSPPPDPSRCPSCGTKRPVQVSDSLFGPRGPWPPRRRGYKRLHPPVFAPRSGRSLLIFLK